VGQYTTELIIVMINLDRQAYLPPLQSHALSGVRRAIWQGMLGLLYASLAACSGGGVSQQSLSTPDSFEPRPKALYVDVQGFFPLQANLMITWPGCRAAEDFTLLAQTERRFTLEIPTRQMRPPNCPGQGTPWEQIIALDLNGLRAGMYEVNVNGVLTTFELPVDMPASTPY